MIGEKNHRHSGNAGHEGRVAYLRGRLESLNCSALIIDIGPLGPPGVAPDIDNAEVTRQGGWGTPALLQTGEKDRIMEIMGKGAQKLLSLLFFEGKIDGVIGLGGNQGSAVSSMAMQGLPFGFPKYLVSTVASGNIRPYVGNKDIGVVFSVGDFLGGANPVISSILANAAAAVVGMAELGVDWPRRPENDHRRDCNGKYGAGRKQGRSPSPRLRRSVAISASGEADRQGNLMTGPC